MENKEFGSSKIASLTHTGRQLCECIFCVPVRVFCFWHSEFNRPISPALAIISSIQEDGQAVCRPTMEPVIALQKSRKHLNVAAVAQKERVVH